MSNHRQFAISDLFSIVYGNGALTKAYIHENPGAFPVFGASADPGKSAGSISTFDFESDALSFVRIGYAGHVALRKAPFSVTCNVLVLKPKPEWAGLLHLPYMVPIISSSFRMVATGRFKEDGRQDYTQINQKMALNATISVPVDEDDKPDLKEQISLSDRYERLKGVRSSLAGTAARLFEFRFALDLREVKYAELPLSEAFAIIRGNSEYTEKYALAHAGHFPLYTAATRNIKPDKISMYDHNVEALHYTTEGAHAGTVFHRPKHKFSMSGHAGILVRKTPEIFYDYALYEVSRVFGGQGFRWASNTPSKSKISDLMLRFPVDPAGKLDVKAQQAIAKRMSALLRQRDETVEALKRLAAAEVTFEAA